MWWQWTFPLIIQSWPTLEIKAYVGKRKINLAIKCYLQWALNMGPLVSKFMYGGSSGVEPRQSPMEALTKCSQSMMRGALTLSLRERENDCSKQ